MDRDSKRFLAIELLLLATLLMAFLAGSGFNKLQQSPTNAEAKNYTVKELLAEKPLGKQVVVRGQLTRELEDYESQSGNTYQQFYISNNGAEVLVFCNTAGGRFNTGQVGDQDQLKVAGEFKNYYGQVEIYTPCSSIASED